MGDFCQFLRSFLVLVYEGTLMFVMVSGIFARVVKHFPGTLKWMIIYCREVVFLGHERANVGWG